MKADSEYLRLALLFSFFLFCLLSSLPAQESREIEITLQNASWISAMTGEPTSEPLETSYGPLLVSSGRLIYSCTNDGTPVIQRATGKRNNKFVSVLENNLFATVSNSRTLNLFNPSGLLLWSADSDFEITGQVLQCRDGRLIVRGDKNLGCYGITGMRKWSVETESLADLPLCQMNDGSLLVFLARKDGDKTLAKRISPFGEEMEEIVFAGNVVAAAETPKGVLLAFSNGSVGLSAVRKSDGRAASSWVKVKITSGSNVTFRLLAGADGRAIAISTGGGGTLACIFSIATGEVENLLNFSGINAADLLAVQDCFAQSKNTLVLADSTKAMSVFFDGSVVWEAKFPPKGSGEIPWQYVFYTKNNNLIFFTSAWGIIAFKTDSNLINISSEEKNYSGYLGSDYAFFDSEAFRVFQFYTKLEDHFPLEELYEALQLEDYGKHERQYKNLVMSAATAYKNTLLSTEFPRKPPNVFLLDTEGTDSLLELLALLGTKDATKMMASLLDIETNLSHIRMLLRGISYCPYDTDGTMLKALFRLSQKSNPRDDTTQLLICQALYSMFTYMGEPFLQNGGRELLVERLNRKYSVFVRNQARNYLAIIANSLK